MGWVGYLWVMWSIEFLVAKIPVCSGVKLQVVSANLESAAESNFECIFESTEEPLNGSQSPVNFQSAVKTTFEWISIRSKLASDAFLILTSRCINSRLHPADDAPYKRVSAQTLLSRFLIGVQFKAKEEADKDASTSNCYLHPRLKLQRMSSERSCRNYHTIGINSIYLSQLKSLIKLREDVQYYFADFVRKGFLIWGVPAPPLTNICLLKNA